MEIVKPLKYNELRKCLQDQWDADFIESMSFDLVTDLLLAAEFVKCISLVDLCYARLAIYFRSRIIII